MEISIVPTTEAPERKMDSPPVYYREGKVIGRLTLLTSKCDYCVHTPALVVPEQCPDLRSPENTGPKRLETVKCTSPTCTCSATTDYTVHSKCLLSFEPPCTVCKEAIDVVSEDCLDEMRTKVYEDLYKQSVDTLSLSQCIDMLTYQIEYNIPLSGIHSHPSHQNVPVAGTACLHRDSHDR